MNQEKTLAELAQGATGIATLKVGDDWCKGIVFANGGHNQAEKYFGFTLKSGVASLDMFVISRFRVLNNGVKVGSEVLAIPAAELKALLSERENG